MILDLPVLRVLTSHARMARLHAYIKAHATLALSRSHRTIREHPRFHTTEATFDCVYVNTEQGWSAVVHDHGYYAHPVEPEEIDVKWAPDRITVLHNVGRVGQRSFKYSVDTYDYEDEDET
jgi:hypothetical protein